MIELNATERSARRQWGSARRAFAAAALIAAAGCASGEDHQMLVEDPAFARGFGDGCTTSREQNKSFSTERVRDAYAFENDRAYRSGWRQGYLDCQGQNYDRNDGGRILGDEPTF